MNSKMDHRLKHKIVKPLEKNIEENLWNPELGKEFLGLT